MRLSTSISWELELNLTEKKHSLQTRLLRKVLESQAKEIIYLNARKCRVIADTLESAI